MQDGPRSGLLRAQWRTDPVGNLSFAPRSCGARRLIINADDLGFTPGINRGIFEAASAGTLTSASMMVNAPGWDDALDRLRSSENPLSVGLHLNLTVGAPLTRSPSLLGTDGRFLPVARLVVRALRGAVDERDVEKETTAQLQALLRAGVSPTHLDSHRHVHLLPGVRRPVARVAAEFGICTVRAPLEPLRCNTHRFNGSMKKFALLAANAGDTRRGRASPRIHFRGISLRGGDDFATDLFAVLATLPVGITELMVHPGYSCSSLAVLDSYSFQREIELHALTSPELLRRIHESHIELTNFAAL
jgi:predicted glycoside hydrolase/deacetylase ChbG (UPF0249 family)